MRTLIIALVLAAGCSIAPAYRSEALDDVPDMTPPPGACGNGNVVCLPGQLCVNGDCLTLCGSAACWQMLQGAWQQCGG